MLIVTQRAQVGNEEYQYKLSDGTTRVSTVYFNTGDEVIIRGKILCKFKPKPQWTTQTRWVREEDVDESSCDITEYGKYDNGEPNGWVEIEYEVNSFGKTRKPE